MYGILLVAKSSIRFLISFLTGVSYTPQSDSPLDRNLSSSQRPIFGLIMIQKRAFREFVVNFSYHPPPQKSLSMTSPLAV